MGGLPFSRSFPMVFTIDAPARIIPLDQLTPKDRRSSYGFAVLIRFICFG